MLVPAVETALPIFAAEDTDILSIIHEMLRINVPGTYLWLLVFYGFFHCWLNILAEITFFADRSFYEDWWNACTLSDYWRMWNKPVHLWLKRHVLNPLRQRQYSGALCVTLVFLFSAVCHEYIISGACRVFVLWTFVAMLVQAPVLMWMEMIRPFLVRTQLGNVSFWIAFSFVGGPLVTIIYTYRVAMKYN